MLIPLPSTFCSRSVPSTITDNDPLSVVSRRSTRCEKIQIAALLSGTMRRISRARSIVSGVELWHPAKQLLENRVVFVHCIIMNACSCHHATLHLSIVIILHLLALNYLRKNLVLFSKRPAFVQHANPGLQIILFCPLSVCRSFVLNK